ncbi:alpha-L-fucosidase [Nonomuraea sp. NPDC049421]|uniref:alpha-L-fucosidase n=1 Tax=Nonomuraea sp. NPDC049421 TaxID=3155275 RepID=UPI00341FBCDA
MPGFDQPKTVHHHWDWPDPEHHPDTAYQANFKARTLQLAQAYRPDVVYFDDTVLPPHQCGPVGLEIAAELYNLGEDMIVCGKILDERRRRALTWDVERGASDRIEPHPWQTRTCLGSWHYDARRLAEHTYKSAAQAVGMLADVVNKNGNLLLSVPITGDGEIDDDECAILAGIGDRLAVNGEAIFDTALARPDGPVVLRRLGRVASLLDREITGVHALGDDRPVRWRHEDQALIIESPAQVHRIDLTS